VVWALQDTVSPMGDMVGSFTIYRLGEE
jgi:hypothetical protein